MTDTFFYHEEPLFDQEPVEAELELSIGDTIETIDLSRDTPQVESEPPDRVQITPGNGRNNALEAEIVEYSTTVPAYLQGAKHGHAYIIRLASTAHGAKLSKQDVLKRALEFQYSKAAVVTNRPTFCSVLNTQAHRWKYRCSGVKHCEYLQEGLKQYSHNGVNDQVFNDIQGIRSAVPKLVLTPEKTKASSLYMSVKRRFNDQSACGNHRETCQPYMSQQQQEPLTGRRKWYIGCRSFTASPRDDKHFIRWVTADTDISYLKQLFTEGLPPREIATTKCNVIEPTSSGIKTCGVDHPQGQGKMLKYTECGVEFHVIIPEDLESCPYFVIVVFGVHSHAPHAPFITEGTTVDAVLAVLHPMLTPKTSRSDFLKSPQLSAYLQSRGLRSIEDLDASLTNKDRIVRLIRKEKLTRFPFGGDIEGVMFEWRMRHQEPETAYIRKIVTSAFGSIIVGLYDEQAQIFLQQTTFQMDMSFKRLEGKWNEILFACFDQVHGKIITLGRIITDTQRSKMYELAFTWFFELLGDRSGKLIQWYHLHIDGFLGTTVDMDSKQMAGFGRYLSRIDPEHRPWQWQLQSSMRFCQVHFIRSINRVCPTCPHIAESRWGRMRSLLDVENPTEYYKLCELLEVEEKSDAVTGWVRHKKNKVIAAGLVQSCSNIPKQVWNMLESHSNAAEQAGQKGYRTGTRLPLLEGIKMAMQMDLQDVREYQMRHRFGNRHADRSTLSLSQRFYNNIGREQKRKQSREVIEIMSDEEDAVLELADSSGYIRQPRKKRSTQRLGGQPLRANTRLSPRTQSPRSSPAPQKRQTQLDIDKEKFYEKQERVAFENKVKEWELEQKEAALRLKERELGILEAERKLAFRQQG